MAEMGEGDDRLPVFASDGAHEKLQAVPSGVEVVAPMYLTWHPNAPAAHAPSISASLARDTQSPTAPLPRCKRTSRCPFNTCTANHTAQQTQPNPPDPIEPKATRPNATPQHTAPQRNAMQCNATCSTWTLEQRRGRTECADPEAMADAREELHAEHSEEEDKQS
eukprot:642261-Rhodomonas_salina.6